MLSAFSQAWASWKTAPGVALLAVVAFAVGIGSATAIFTVVNGVLLRPLPYPDGERFVSLYGVNTTNPGTMMTMSVPELQDYEQQTTSFDAFGWFRTGRFRLTAPGEPQFVPGAAVTPALARQLGPPRLGQWFVDDTSAVISTSLWRRLGGGREIIGSAITLDERQYTITGVMPPTFQLPLASLGISRGDTEVWIPLDPSPPDANRGSGHLRRVRPPQTRGVAGTGEGGRQASRHRRRRHRSRTLPELHGGRGRPARGDDRDGRRDASAPRC